MGFYFETSLMKKAISTVWIIGAVLLIGAPAYSEVISFPVPQVPDPALIGRPPVPGMPFVPGLPPYVGQPIVSDIQYVEPEYVSFIKKLEAIPENKIDVGLVALKLAKDIHPKLDIKAYSAKIDKLAARVRAFTKGSTNPDTRVRGLNGVLFWQVGISYDTSDPLGEKIDTRLISGVLDRKKGVCNSIPLLYLAVAQRLGYPVYPVSAPQHCFLRYVDPRYTEQNIETTGKGCYGPDSTYIEWLKVTPKSIKSGAYLRTLTYKEYVGHLIALNSLYWSDRDDGARALYYMAAARRLYPKSAEICQWYGGLLVCRSKQEGGEDAIYDSKTGKQCLKMAEDMGVSHLTEEDYIKELALHTESPELQRVVPPVCQAATKRVLWLSLNSVSNCLGGL